MFQQDGSTAYYSISVRQYLDRKLGDNWIQRGGPTAWPPRSPDLTPSDFFLSGQVKGEVSSIPIESLNHLKSRIRQAIRRIDPIVSVKV